METTVSRIFIFPSGARIDLKRIIMIGALDKDEVYNIIVPVYTEKRDKPILFTLGNSIGHVTPEQGKRIHTIYGDFCREWELYTMQNEKENS